MVDDLKFSDSRHGQLGVWWGWDGMWKAGGELNLVGGWGGWSYEAFDLLLRTFILF